MPFSGFHKERAVRSNGYSSLLDWRSFRFPLSYLGGSIMAYLNGLREYDGGYLTPMLDISIRC